MVLEMVLPVLLLVKAEKYSWNRQIPLSAVAI
nr:MAG TPA: hypothetical protein [Caudoviricetes sp.]